MGMLRQKTRRGCRGLDVWSLWSSSSAWKERLTSSSSFLSSKRKDFSSSPSALLLLSSRASCRAFASSSSSPRLSSSLLSRQPKVSRLAALPSSPPPAPHEFAQHVEGLRSSSCFRQFPFSQSSSSSLLPSFRGEKITFFYPRRTLLGGNLVNERRVYTAGRVSSPQEENGQCEEKKLKKRQKEEGKGSESETILFQYTGNLIHSSSSPSGLFPFPFQLLLLLLLLHSTPNFPCTPRDSLGQGPKEERGRCKYREPSLFGTPNASVLTDVVFCPFFRKPFAFC